MSKRKSNEQEEEKKPTFSLGEDVFKNLEEKEELQKWKFGKRLVVSAIFYAFPSNLNAHGGVGTNIISQKIIPWGKDAEPRIYVSPYALKRRIRDYWTKKGQKVYLREDVALIEEMKDNILEYIDNDLFGYMKTEQGKDVRQGAITSWGAVSIEPLHTFIDFNTNILSTSGSEEGGSIINRQISKEFYFTSFFINPDIIGVDFKNNSAKYVKYREERLRLFFEALKYAMQKDSGGARDRPACVFMGVEICDYGYGKSDKEIFNSIEVRKDKVKLLHPVIKDDKFHILEMDKNFVEGVDKNIEKIDEIIKNLKND